MSWLQWLVSHISDHSDMNFIYIPSVNKCQQQIRKNTSEQTKHQTKHDATTKPEFVYKQTHESCVCCHVFVYKQTHESRVCCHVFVYKQTHDSCVCLQTNTWVTCLLSRVCLQTNTWVTWLKLLGSKVFRYQKNESALTGTNRLVKDLWQISGSIQEHFITILAPGTHNGHCWKTNG